MQIFLFFFFLLSSCVKFAVLRNASPLFETKKKSLYAVEKKSHNDLKRYNRSSDYYYESINLLESNPEEEIFLDDIQFKVVNKGSRKIATGIKLAKKNNITDKIFAFDQKELMDSVGFCRAKLFHFYDDLKDDGVINYSSKNDQCLLKNGVRRFDGKKIALHEFSFFDITDWKDDDFQDAIVAFLSSCKRFATKNEIIKSKSISFGSSKDWLYLCNIAEGYLEVKEEKTFFERYFSPFLVIDKTKDNDSDIGKFTSYYIWELEGSRTHSVKNWYPIYTTPQECRGKSSCYSKDEIHRGILANRNLEVLWTDNPLDVYFMQLQGSGIVKLEDGTLIRLGYESKNNMKFESISKFFQENKEFLPKGLSYYDSIDIVKQNPEISMKAVSCSQSYVFFRELPGLEFIGGMGVGLTPSRSIAIDPEFIPYGMPMWIETNLPIFDKNGYTKDGDEFVDFNRLWIAQDTGSAIKGVIRADLYMGYGAKASFIARNTKFAGRYYMLIPNSIINKIQILD